MLYEAYAFKDTNFKIEHILTFHAEKGIEDEPDYIWDRRADLGGITLRNVVEQYSSMIIFQVSIKNDIIFIRYIH